MSKDAVADLQKRATELVTLNSATVKSTSGENFAIVHNQRLRCYIWKDGIFNVLQKNNILWLFQFDKLRTYQPAVYPVTIPSVVSDKSYSKTSRRVSSAMIG